METLSVLVWKGLGSIRQICVVCGMHGSQVFDSVLDMFGGVHKWDLLALLVLGLVCAR